MGGHAAGREAAELALSTIFEVFDDAADATPPSEVLRAAIEEASRRVHVMRTSEIAFGRPGSTVVAILVHAHGTEVGHVGDSRAYLVHEGQIFRVTRDHSIVQEMVDRGLLTPQQAVHHPDANRITRALGMASEVEAEVRPQPVHHVTGDAFVLCSDGLSDLVDDHEILGIVGGEPAAQAAGKLVDLANARGGHDNVTVIVLRARETALASTAPIAPTVAQTSLTQPPPTAPLPPAAGSTLVESPPAPDVLPSRPLEPTIPPHSTPPVRRGSPVVVIGLVLAVLAIVLLGAVLFEHLASRAGRRNGPSGAPLPLTASSSAAAPSAVVAPASVDAPPAAPPAAPPIAPLDTTPPTRGRR
jgi:protein phosphatase